MWSLVYCRNSVGDVTQFLNERITHIATRDPRIVVDVVSLGPHPFFLVYCWLLFPGMQNIFRLVPQLLISPQKCKELCRKSPQIILLPCTIRWGDSGRFWGLTLNIFSNCGSYRLTTITCVRHQPRRSRSSIWRQIGTRREKKDGDPKRSQRKRKLQPEK